MFYFIIAAKNKEKITLWFRNVIAELPDAFLDKHLWKVGG